MTGRKLLEFTDAQGYTVKVTAHPANVLHLAILSPYERHYARIGLSSAEHLAAALTGAPAGATEPGELVSFLDLDTDVAVSLTREPTGRYRLILSGVEDWERYAEFVQPDADRLAAVLSVAAHRPHQ